MPPKVILFAGAPPVPLDPAAFTITAFSDPFLSLLHLPPEPPAPDSRTPASPPPSVSWRSLPAARQPLRTGWTPPPYRDFFTTTTTDHDEPERADGADADDDLLTRFYEESFAAAHPSLVEDSFQTTLSEDTTHDDASTARDIASCPLSHLRDIPRAADIASLAPQTITRNLVLAVLAVAPPRAVTTRWGSTFSLVEVLVGDDTRSGFAITFWLAAGGRGRGGSADADAVVVASLRRQDVVLVRNVALQVFRGKVYGQSLPRGLTKVELLWRQGGGGRFAARDLAAGRAARAAGGERARAGVVRDWVMRFVGGGGDGGGTPGTRSRAQVWDRPPDDTQD